LGGTLVRPTIFTVERKGAGAISTMARPRGGDWLDDELSALRAIGVGVLVSMLTASETRELDLTEEPRAAQAVGLRFLSLPTPDRGVPEKASFLVLLDELRDAVRVGTHVVVHCRMGIGRSSLVAAGLLVREGLGADEAWAAVERARGLEVPDTPEQKAWLASVLAE
jgi:protein-tyrosine phosphatase